MSRTLEQEQEAFGTLLPGLMKDHEGQYVLFKNGAVVSFKSTFSDAYADGLKHFGQDVFLIDRVTEPVRHTTALSWATGAMLVSR